MERKTFDDKYLFKYTVVQNNSFFTMNYKLSIKVR